MNDEMRNIKRFALMLLLTVGWMPSAQAQILSRGDLFGPGAPPPLVGIEIGVGQHSEIGIADCDCGSTFSGGTGTGLIGSLFFELPLDYEWAIGIKGGIDFKNFSTTENVNELVVVQPSDSAQPISANINDNHTAIIKTTYLDFAPYVQYQFFRMGPFAQVGLDFGFLLANSLTQNRQLPQGTSATAGGVTYNNLTFTNGTLTEVIQNGSTSVSSLRLGLLLSAGYNIQVSERSVFSPLITYDFPLTVAGSTGGSNWRIGSLYASALLKFQLN
jgi:Outer membrane protein beta-barrel domain